MDKLYEYQNGNTKVTILEDGTKIREYEDIPLIEHPESIDCKITNYCDLGCQYCHENSTTKGKHADLSILLYKFKDLPAGVELAIGGGNSLAHPNILPFLHELRDRGLIANITVNQQHVKEYYSLLVGLIKNDLVKGVGISIVNNDYDNIKMLMKLTNNIVFHVIAGVNSINVIDELNEIGNYCKILILGYKTFGRGVKYKSKEVDDNIQDWYKRLAKHIGNTHLSFDNLAIEQLNVKRFFTEKGWSKFYMGDDGTFTMYIDAVNQEYAPTSRSDDRKSFNDYSLTEYFSKIINSKK